MALKKNCYFDLTVTTDEIFVFPFLSKALAVSEYVTFAGEGTDQLHEYALALSEHFRTPFT